MGWIKNINSDIYRNIQNMFLNSIISIFLTSYPESSTMVNRIIRVQKLCE